jgi:hypothetical protein
MSSDKRKNVRRPLRQPAMMLNVDGSMLGLCVILDVSATGARLEPPQSIEVPNEFILLLTRNRNVRRRCKVVRRQGSAIGVRFSAVQSLNQDLA